MEGAGVSDTSLRRRKRVAEIIGYEEHKNDAFASAD
jgi:hypothetical protein